MIGIEILSGNGGARRFCEELKARGLIGMLARDDVIRITPPLVITQPEIDWALEKIRMVMC